MSQNAPETSKKIPGLDALLNASVLVVTRRGWLIPDYGIFDQHGRLLAGVQPGAQPLLAKRLEIRAPQGLVLLRLQRPPELFSWTMTVSDHDRQEIGRFVGKTGLRMGFSLQARGETYGVLRAGRWDTGSGYLIKDRVGTDIARMTRTPDGHASHRSTLEIDGPLPEPLSSLIVAVPFAVEIWIKERIRNA